MTDILEIASERNNNSWYMRKRKVSKARRPDFIAMACTTASVSFREVLTPDELINALLSGEVPKKRRPHVRTLFDEAPPALLQGLTEDVARWAKPGKLEKNLRKLAIDLRATHGVERWLKTG